MGRVLSSVFMPNRLNVAQTTAHVSEQTLPTVIGVNFARMGCIECQRGWGTSWVVACWYGYVCVVGESKGIACSHLREALLLYTPCACGISGLEHRAVGMRDSYLREIVLL